MNPTYLNVNMGLRHRLAKFFGHLRWIKEITLALLVAEFLAHRTGFDDYITIMSSFAIEEFHLWIVISIYGMLSAYGLLILRKNWPLIRLLARKIRRGYRDVST